MDRNYKKILALLLFFLFSQNTYAKSNLYRYNLDSKKIKKDYLNYKNKNTKYFLQNKVYFKSDTFSSLFVTTFPLNITNQTQFQKILNIYKDENRACYLYKLLKKYKKNLSNNQTLAIKNILYFYCPYEPYIKPFRDKYKNKEDIYKRAYLLFKNKQFKDAFYYAKNLPLTKDKYKYLVARIYYINGKRKKATRIMESISENNNKYKIKKYYFLSLWKKNPEDKLFYFNRLLKTDKDNLKKIVLNALLNYAFYKNNETFFFNLLNISKSLDKNIYGTYAFRYYYYYGDYKKAYNATKYIKNKDLKIFYALLSKRFLNENLTISKYLSKFSNFSKYKVILSPPKKISVVFPKRDNIKNKILRLYLKKDKKFAKILLETYKFSSLDEALAYYFLGDYYHSIKYASKNKKLIKKYPYILVLLYPQGYKKEIKKLLKVYNSSLPENYIYGLIRKESLFNEKAISWAGAQGLMQIMPFTAKYISKKLDIPYNFYKLLDPSYNLKLGIWYADYLYKKTKNLALVSGAYNAGIRNIYRFIGKDTPCYNTLDFLEIVDFFVKYPETRNYILDTLKNYYIYKAIYTKEGNNETTCTISP